MAIDELVDLIEHEPQKGGFLGVKEKEHEAYLKQIFGVIERWSNMQPNHWLDFDAFCESNRNCRHEAKNVRSLSDTKR